MADLFEQIRDLLLGFLEANQYYALALLIGIEEAGVPLPLPGDLAIMFMGSQIALGSAHPVGVVVVAAASATAGASVLYWLARRLGLEMLRRFGRYVRVDESKIESFEDWFRQHGGLAIIVGRMIPGLRIAVAVFAGLARVPFPRFVLYTSISSTIWAGFFTALGWYFGSRWTEVSEILERVIGNPWVAAVLGLAIGIALTRLYYRRRQRLSNTPQEPVEVKTVELPPPAPEIEFKVSEPAEKKTLDTDPQRERVWRSRPDSNRRSPP